MITGKGETPTAGSVQARMIRIRIIILMLGFTIIGNHTFGQVDYEQQLYNAYVEGRILDWKPILAGMQAKYKKEKQPELLYALCFAQYGYIGHCISKDLDDEAKDCLKKAEKNAEELERIYRGRHDILALQGAFTGFRIMLSKFSAMYLAPRAFKLVKTASASSDKFFNCSLETGNIRYFTPKFLGGSKEEAIEYYENAVKLLEKNALKGKPSWIYINTLLLLSNAYYDTGAKDQACKTYQRILAYEPGIQWIRDEMNKKCNN